MSTLCLFVCFNPKHAHVHVRFNTYLHWRNMHLLNIHFFKKILERFTTGQLTMIMIMVIIVANYIQFYSAFYQLFFCKFHSFLLKISVSISIKIHEISHND